MQREICLMRFEGGPMDGMTSSPPIPWPFPEYVSIHEHTGGLYVKDKSRESKLEAPMKGVARGATFVWTTDIAELAFQ